MRSPSLVRALVRALVRGKWCSFARAHRPAGLHVCDREPSPAAVGTGAHRQRDTERCRPPRDIPDLGGETGYPVRPFPGNRGELTATGSRSFLYAPPGSRSEVAGELRGGGLIRARGCAANRAPGRFRGLGRRSRRHLGPETSAHGARSADRATSPSSGSWRGGSEPISCDREAQPSPRPAESATPPSRREIARLRRKVAGTSRLPDPMVTFLPTLSWQGPGFVYLHRWRLLRCPTARAAQVEQPRYRSHRRRLVQ